MVPSLGAGNKKEEVSVHTHTGDHLSGLPGFDEVIEHFHASREVQEISSGGTQSVRWSTQYLWEGPLLQERLFK